MSGRYPGNGAGDVGGRYPGNDRESCIVNSFTICLQRANNFAIIQGHQIASKVILGDRSGRHYSN